MEGFVALGVALQQHESMFEGKEKTAAAQQRHALSAYVTQWKAPCCCFRVAFLFHYVFMYFEAKIRGLSKLNRRS